MFAEIHALSCVPSGSCYLTISQISFIIISFLKWKWCFQISASERVEMSEKSYGLVSSGADYYRIPFTQVLDLVRGRKVFLHHGHAYITNSEIISVLLSVFRSRLSHELSVSWGGSWKGLRFASKWAKSTEKGELRTNFSVNTSLKIASIRKIRENGKS